LVLVSSGTVQNVGSTGNFITIFHHKNQVLDVLNVINIYFIMDDLYKEYKNPQFKIIYSRYNLEHFRYKEDISEDIWSGNTLPRFQTKRFDSLLPGLAEIDIELAKKIESTYEEINELEHYRQLIIEYINDEIEEDQVFRDMTKTFIGDFQEEKTAFFKILEETYRSLTKKDLNDFRLW